MKDFRSRMSFCHAGFLNPVRLDLPVFNGSHRFGTHTITVDLEYSILRTTCSTRCKSYHYNVWR